MSPMRRPTTTIARPFTASPWVSTAQPTRPISMSEKYSADPKASAHDLDERAGRDAGADGTEVHVECADRDGSAFLEAEFLRPFGGETARQIAGGVDLVGQRLA